MIMAKKKISGGVALLLALLGLALGWDQWKSTTPPPSDPAQKAARAQFTEGDLRYQGQPLIVTKHARCRMGCRFLDAYEVQQVLDQGRINPKKNRPAQGDRCKSLAYEGRSPDGQLARIIVGDCEDRPILITVIDLDTKHSCSCD